MAETAALLLLAWLGANALVLAAHRRTLRGLWREPVFAVPVLVLDSDDWGAGPLVQAEALREIADTLARHADAGGKAPVMNLALVLAVPDGPASAAAGAYRRVELDESPFAPVFAALRAGAARGVFALQLHGHEHCWPAALLASPDARVAEWLRRPVPAATEDLPPPLQSRWVDASALPSRPLPAAEIDAAAAGEVAAFARIVGAPPAAVVPPTFVWTREVERAWARAGVGCVVTPGRRSTLRDAQGRPAGDEGPLRNGDRSDDPSGSNLVYVVRSDYFEPERGRDAAHALRALERAVAEGRPCVLENHRSNFIGDAALRARSLAELDALCRGALRAHPALRCLATAELARILRERDPQWLATGLRGRLPRLWARLAATGRPWTLLRLTGAAPLVGLLLRALAPASPPAPQPLPR